MDPRTLQFCDPAYERAFICARASESMKSSWVFMWLLVVGLKLAQLTAAAEMGQLHEAFDDKGTILASIACIAFWWIYRLQDKEQAHSIGSIISSSIFMISTIPGYAFPNPGIPTENVSEVVLVTILDMENLFLYALLAHLLHLKPLHKFVAAAAQPISHTLFPAYCVGWEVEVLLVWMAAVAGCLLGYMLESSLRTAYRMQDMEARRFAAMLTALENTDSTRNSMARRQCKVALSYLHLLNDLIPEGDMDLTRRSLDAVQQLSTLLGKPMQDDTLKTAEATCAEAISPVPLCCVAMSSDPMWRCKMLSFFKHFLHADMQRSCSLGADTIEVTSFEEVVLGKLDRVMMPPKEELCAADMVFIDEVVYTGSDCVLGSDLAGMLQVCGFCGITCLFSTGPPTRIMELEENPGVDLVVDRNRGVNFVELTSQVISLREVKITNYDHIDMDHVKWM